MPRLAANLGYLFAERPLLDRFGAAAACGFSAVELTFPYSEPADAVRREIERHRLQILGINTPLGAAGELGLAGIPGRERDFDVMFGTALDYATAIGATSIHCMSGQVPSHLEAEGEKVLAANIARAADRAAERGLTILLEPINRRDRPGYLLYQPEQAAAVIDRAGRPNVRIQFDFYHVQIEGGDLMTRFARFSPVVGHIQIAAVPSRAEPDEGEVSYAAILDMIDSTGYAGFVACEYKPRKRTEDGLGWAKRYGIGGRNLLYGPADHDSG
jgi:hydroxypyruvate isomerase